jgi:polyhydroxyalkanoate synthesis regulator phasin
MGDVSSRLYQLRPVTFHYKTADARGEHPLQFGLVAEEVSEVLPELVIRNKDGQPETVAYHLLPALLLSELQKQYRKVLAQEEELAAQARQLSEVNTQVDELRRQVRQLAERQQENPDGSVRAGVALPQLR